MRKIDKLIEELGEDDEEWRSVMMIEVIRDELRELAEFRSLVIEQLTRIADALEAGNE